MHRQFTGNSYHLQKLWAKGNVVNVSGTTLELAIPYTNQSPGYNAALRW